MVDARDTVVTKTHPVSKTVKKELPQAGSTRSSRSTQGSYLTQSLGW